MDGPGRPKGNPFPFQNPLAHKNPKCANLAFDLFAKEPIAIMKHYTNGPTADLERLAVSRRTQTRLEPFKAILALHERPHSGPRTACSVQTHPNPA
jgi:hypothetical protein